MRQFSKGKDNAYSSVVLARGESCVKFPGRLVGIFLIGVVLLVGLAGCETSKHYSIRNYYTTTNDGYLLGLRRYKPKHLSADKDPVILCHGLSYNMLFWDLEDKVSLARYLAGAGYDVWSLSLRGAAPSSQPVGSSLRKLAHFHLDPELLLTAQKRMSKLQMTDWTVDDHIDYDIPAALKFVRKKTKHQKLHWVGHSMGGMIMFAYLEKYPQMGEQGLRSFVAAATPMAMFHPLSKPCKFLEDTQEMLDIGSRVVGSSAPATWGVLFGDTGTPMDRLFYNSRNMDTHVIRELYRVAQEEISPGQLKQLIDMVRTESFHSYDGKLDYTAMLDKVNIPTLFLVGTVDNLATPGAVRYAYRQIDSGDKQFNLFGWVNGQKNDYGHDDIILGKNARQEVYPVILQWLNKHPNKPGTGPMMMQPAKTQTNTRVGKQ